MPATFFFFFFFSLSSLYVGAVFQKVAVIIIIIYVCVCPVSLLCLWRVTGSDCHLETLASGWLGVYLAPGRSLRIMK